MIPQVESRSTGVEMTSLGQLPKPQASTPDDSVQENGACMADPRPCYPQQCRPRSRTQVVGYLGLAVPQTSRVFSDYAPVALSALERKLFTMFKANWYFVLSVIVIAFGGIPKGKHLCPCMSTWSS
jgi:hypothetical protein